MDSFVTATAPFENGPFESQGTEAHGSRHHNQPPLEERILLEFDEALRKPYGDNGKTLQERIDEIVASAGRVPEQILDERTCGLVGDLLKLAGNVQKAVEAERETHNRPLLNAQRALKTRMDAVLQPLLAIGGPLRGRMNEFVAEREAKRREQERLAAEAARKATEAAQAAAPTEELVPQVQAAFVPKTQVRGDYGSTVSSKQIWTFEREVEVKKLPKAILENEKVQEAVDSVIRSMVRSGTRKIAGVRIFQTTSAQVR